jgi:hypothetical protein
VSRPLASRVPRLRAEEWVLLAIAILWSAALVLFATMAPVYESDGGETFAGRESWTLVEENGSGILLIVSVPVLVTVIVGCALWFRGARRGAGPFAWTFTGLLAVFNLAAMLSIGILIIPVTGCLVAACILREVISPAEPATPRP